MTMGTKLSASLADDDVEFIDRYAQAHGVPSRSAVIQRALSLLRASELRGDYAAAWAEWEDDVWDRATADGLEADRR